MSGEVVLQPCMAMDNKHTAGSDRLHTQQKFRRVSAYEVWNFITVIIHQDPDSQIMLKVSMEIYRPQYWGHGSYVHVTLRKLCKNNPLECPC